MLLRCFLEKYAKHYDNKGKKLSFLEKIAKENIRLIRQLYIKTYILLINIQNKLFPISSEEAIKRGVIILGSECSYTTFLTEVALEKIGFRDIEILHPDRIYRLYDSRKFCVVLFANVIENLPINNYIVLQLEQGTSQWFTNTYLQKLKKALAVWDFSAQNIEYLAEKGVLRNKLFLTPLSNIVQYKDFLKQKNINLQRGEKEYDVVFYGSINERRQRFLDKIASKFSLHIVYGYGENLYNELLKAKIVVNIHYYENALLESLRIYECISLGVNVVSETAVDIDAYNNLKKYIRFTPYGDIDAMLNSIEDILKNYKEDNNIDVEINDFSAGIKDSFNHLGLLNEALKGECARETRV